MRESTTQALLAAAIAGERACLARLLSLIERQPQVEADVRQALASHAAQAVVIGVTGPPGAGKSTLISALLSLSTASFGKTAVLAVDPSSPFSGGALLGDRVRMQNHGLGDAVFIRSMASKGENGGLARTTATAIQVLDACGWPLILLETLGIGQVELDVMDLATVVTVVLNHPMLVYTDPPAMHQFLSNPHPKSYAPQLSSSLNPLHASAAQSPFMSVKSS